MSVKTYSIVCRIHGIALEEMANDPVNNAPMDYDKAKEVLLVLALSLVKKSMDVLWLDNEKREAFSYSMYDHVTCQNVTYFVGIESN